MTTANRIRVTSCAPESLLVDARHLAAAWGRGPADLKSYVGGHELDGTDYYILSAMVPDSYLTLAESDPQRPVWDTDEIIDMDAAQRAYDALTVYPSIPQTEEGEEPEPLAKPDGIVAVVAGDAQSAIRALGIEKIETDETI